MNERRFEYVDDKSNKFWTIRVDGASTHVVFGRIGTAGQTVDKTFADAAAAQKSADKLIAEKLGKGYVEIGGAQKPEQTKEEIRNSKSEIRNKSEKQKSKSESADAEIGVPKNSAGLKLTPRDYLWVTYANHPPLKPEPRPFDKKQCEEIINSQSHRYHIGFYFKELPLVMSKQEAEFWFKYFAKEDLVPEKQIRSMNWRNIFGQMSHWHNPIHIALANMISPEEYIDLVIHPKKIDYRFKDYLAEYYNWIRTGFQECVFPYLSENLRADMRKQIRAEWKTLKFGITPLYSAAALLGMHDKITAVVENWPDDEFSYETNKLGEFLCNPRAQEFVFGLGNPDKIEHHMRRLNLRLKSRTHFAAWFAHFGLDRMEWVEESIIALNSQAEAASAVRTIAGLAEDARLAPTMLRLSVESKASEPARKWLEQHPDWSREQLTPIANGKGKLSEAAQRCIKLIEDVQPLKKPAAAQPPAATAAVVISDSIPELNILGENKIERRMTLPPRIACRVTYNRPAPLPLPNPKPFDLDACMARLESTFLPDTDEEIQRLGMVPSMDKREVEFWHLSLTDDHDRLIDEKKWRKKILAHSYPGTITLDQLIHGTQAMTWGDCPRERVALMGALAGLAVATEELLKLDHKKGGWNYEYAEGFFRYLLPYMNGKQIAQARKTALAEWPKHKWRVKNDNGYPHIIFYIAAGLGLHDELLKLIESWPDEAYANYSKPKGRLYHDERAEELVFGLGSSELVGRHFRRLGMKLIDEERAWIWLAHTGAGGLDILFESMKRFRGKNDLMALFKPLQSFESPETAQVMFRMVQANKLAEEARAWIEKHPRLAAAGLIPLANGKGEEAKVAAIALRTLAQANKNEVDAVVQMYPADQAKLIRERLLTDSMQQVSLASKDAMPAWWTEAIAAGLKQVTSLNWLSLRELPPLSIDGRALGDDEMRGVLWAVMKSTLDAPHPMIEALRKRGDAAANDAFARLVCECWLNAQAPSKEKWALLSLGLLGGDEAAMWITPHIRRWPGESQHQRAVIGLDVLRAIGTDSALMQLNGIAQKLKFKALKERAAQCIENIAAARGLTRDELEDLIVPDCGFDERGRYTIDFGPRQFEVVLDAELKPIVRDASGKELSSLPKPASSDDKARAEEAAATFTLMKKQLREVVSIQSTRLERAMIAGRRWPVKTFESCLARHPLMRHLTSRLIWEGLDKTGKRIGLFRVAEDLSYADASDSAIALNAFASVGIPHPLNLNSSEQQAWGKVMADYEITAPFMQFGREICELTPDERDKKEITRWADYEIMGLTIVRTLEKFGWNKCGFSDGGSFNSHYKVYPASGVTAVCEYEWMSFGISPEDDEAQPIHKVFFLDSSRASECYYDSKAALVLSKVDPVAISETLRELTIVASKGKAPAS